MLALQPNFMRVHFFETHSIGLRFRILFCMTVLFLKAQFAIVLSPCREWFHLTQITSITNQKKCLLCKLAEEKNHCSYVYSVFQIFIAFFRKYSRVLWGPFWRQESSHRINLCRLQLGAKRPSVYALCTLIAVARHTATVDCLHWEARSNFWL